MLLYGIIAPLICLPEAFMKLIRSVRILLLVALLAGQHHRSVGQTVTDTAFVTLDSNAVVRVDKIFIIGNRRTKPRIILREMDAKAQTAYVWHELQAILTNDRRRIINTKLFLRVDIRKILVDETRLDLIVSVTERWYTIPSPYIKLADRNFNDWRTNYNSNLRRLEYGLKLTQYNFRGLNERLRLDAQFGFTRRFAVQYQKPYIDRAQKNGINLNFAYAETNNVIFQTERHVPVSTDSLRRSLETLTTGLGWQHRGSYYSTHAVDINFFKNQVSDTITELNPRYYLGNRLIQRYFQLGYRFAHDKRDFVGYPLHGFLINLAARKTGLGVFDDVNIWRLHAHYTHYGQLGNNLFASSAVRGMVSGPRIQPYANFSGLGYDGLWLRGYETYAIEGQHFVLHQNSLSYRLFDTVFNLDRVVPFKQFDELPMALYVKAFYDHGAVRNTVNYPLKQSLSNRYLYSAGVALDLVSFYDFVLRVGYPLAVSSGVQQRYFLSFRASF